MVQPGHVDEPRGRERAGLGDSRDRDAHMTTPRRRELLLKLGYAVLFVGVLPALLVLWAWRLDHWLQLPVPDAVWAGGALAAAGIAVMAAGTIALWTYGGGLPMSAFPPERLVARGIYRYVADPLYVGAVTAAMGTSLIFASPSGLWIVSPVLALACVAWVMGFERERTRLRFGAVAHPVLRLPADIDDAPTAWHRAAVYALVFIPWLVTYLSVEFLGAPPGAPSSYFAIDYRIPVVPSSALVYEFVYPMVVLAPLFARRQRDLRPSAFLKHYLEGRVRQVVLPLHSYELLALLIVLAWVTNREWLWGYVLGMALHLPLDIVFNGRLVSGGLVHFYSFAVRARAGFLAERFADPTLLAPLAESFWVSFFRGSRLKSTRASAPRRASRRPSLAAVPEPPES